jgi:PPE-repeat protein
MFYAVFPPEVNSGRMYAGAGSASMRAAAVAWAGLATELQSTAASYSSVISSLTGGGWSGPSSVGMAAAVGPYVAWLHGVAGQAGEVAAQASAAASAFEAAFAGHVPPAQIAANRGQLALLVASNVLGQNTSAIAAVEAQYGQMWAQDAAAMQGYVVASAAATKLTPFSGAPQTTSASGVGAQVAAVGQAAATPAGGVQSLLGALDPLTTGNPLLQWLADLSTDYTTTINDALNGLLGPSGASTYTALFTAVKDPLGLSLQFSDIGMLANFPVSQFLRFAPAPAYAVLPKEGLGGGLGLLSPSFSRGTLFGSVSAGMGNAGTLVGKLSIPPSWATATPAVRTVAAALSAAGPAAVPAAALSNSGLLGSMSVAAMLGSAAGSGAPTVVARTGVRGRLTAFKDLKDKHSPQHLQRLVAQISEKPDSVQHHNVDQDNLDNLLQQLAKKPGIHAVHLTKTNNTKTTPPNR